MYRQTDRERKKGEREREGLKEGGQPKFMIVLAEKHFNEVRAEKMCNQLVFPLFSPLSLLARIKFSRTVAFFEQR